MVYCASLFGNRKKFKPILPFLDICGYFLYDLTVSLLVTFLYNLIHAIDSVFESVLSFLAKAIKSLQYAGNGILLP
jgi:hypothetical protein